MTPQQRAMLVGPWVVRGGVAAVATLQDAYKRFDAAIGVFGFSVVYDPQQQSTVLDLIDAGHLTDRKRICFAERAVLQQAVQPKYVLYLLQSGNNSYHHELTLALALASQPGQYLPFLPDDAAQALSDAFTVNRMDNPRYIP